jgi:hypothetical protein
MQVLFIRLAADISTLHSTLNLKLVGFTAIKTTVSSKYAMVLNAAELLSELTRA